jgi:hypothetical protein
MGTILIVAAQDASVLVAEGQECWLTAGELAEGTY